MTITQRNALIDIIGVLLRANKDEGAIDHAIHSEGIDDAYRESVIQSLSAMGRETVAEMERRYEVKVPKDLMACAFGA